MVYVKEQWRFTDEDGAIRFADSETDAANESLGVEECVYVIYEGEGTDMRVIADCYSAKDAARVKDALNFECGAKPDKL